MTSKKVAKRRLEKEFLVHVQYTLATTHQASSLFFLIIQSYFVFHVEASLLCYDMVEQQLNRTWKAYYSAGFCGNCMHKMPLDHLYHGSYLDGTMLGYSLVMRITSVGIRSCLSTSSRSLRSGSSSSHLTPGSFDSSEEKAVMVIGKGSSNRCTPAKYVTSRRP